jgi:gliding motility-associated-like protein
MTVDTFFVKFKDADTVLNNVDTALCFATATTLFPAGNYDSYLWNTGSTDPGLIVNQDGTYIRQAFKECNAQYDTVKVRFVRFDVTLGNDTLMCPGQSITIGASVAGATYRWQDGSSTDHFTVTQSGLYRLTVSIAPCSLSDSIQVTFYDAASLLLDQGDTAICNERPLHLEAIATGQGSLAWNTGSTSPDINVAKAGTYIVTYTDPCIMLVDSVSISEFNCRCVPFVPNAFSPNGDGNNDVFLLLLTCPVLKFNLKIYNRYGEKVFEADEPGKGWDGIYKNAPSDVGVYFYYLTYKGFNDQVYSKKGDLTLLR